MTKEFKKRFRTYSTKDLIKGYHLYNAEYKQVAREELKKRKVSKKLLPYKPRTKPKQRGLFF